MLTQSIEAGTKVEKGVAITITVNRITTTDPGGEDPGDNTTPPSGGDNPGGDGTNPGGNTTNPDGTTPTP